MAALCGRLGHSDESGGRSTGTCETRSIRWRRQNAQQMSLPTADKDTHRYTPLQKKENVAAKLSNLFLAIFYLIERSINMLGHHHDSRTDARPRVGRGGQGG